MDHAQLLEILRGTDVPNGKYKSGEAKCPCEGCGGKLSFKWFTAAKPNYHCSDGCDATKIAAAIATFTSVRKQHAPPPGGAVSPPSRPAPSSSLPVTSKPHTANTFAPRSEDARRLPPQNIQAEQSVLGAVFLDNETLSLAKSVIQTADFYRETHRIIFEAMIDLAAHNEPIDAITMTQSLRRHGHIEQVGGPAYLAELADTVPTSANIKSYCEIVREMSIKRRIATEATELAAWAYNGSSAESLVGEFQSRAAKLDRVKTNAVADIFSANIQTFTGRDLINRAKTNPKNRVVCDGFLYRKQVSMWAGKVEAGKTTLLRELAMDVIRGDPFLGRACVTGRVTYLMLDADGEDLTFQEFQKMGWNPETEDNLEFVFDPIFAQKPRALDQFHQYLLERQPAMVIVDPLGRFIKADDFNAYGMTYVMAIISELAKATDCHFAVPQHIPRGRSDDADAATAAFGSIAIGGSVNARFVCTHKPGNIYTLKTSRGKGAGFVPLEEELVLEQHPETGRITVKGAYSWKDQAKALMDQVQRIIDDSEDPMTAGDIAARLGIMRSAAGSAAQMLYSEKRPEYRRIDREGKGRAGAPFKFKKLLQISMPDAI